MKDKKMQYIDQICCEIKNILIDRTNYEIKHIRITLDWYKGEQPHLMWLYDGENDDIVTITEERIEYEKEN